MSSNPFVTASAEFNKLTSKPTEEVTPKGVVNVMDTTNAFVQASKDPSNFSITDIPAIANAKALVGQTAGAITGAGKTLVDQVFDFVSRGQYASAKFSQVLAKDGLAALGTALSAGAQEAIDPKERLSYRDIMHPDFVKANPVASEILGFMADIVLDPTTYLSFGSKGLIKAGETALSHKGVKVLGKIAKDTEEAAKLAGVAVSSATARETADQFVTAMISMGNKSLADKGGVKILGRTVIPGDAVKAIIDAPIANGSTLRDLGKVVTDSKPIQAMKAFVRDADLPPEYLALRKSLEGAYSSIGKDVTDATRKMFKGLNASEREQLGNVASQIDDVTRLTELNRGGARVTQTEANQIVQGAMSNTRLNPKQKAVYAQMRQAFNDTALAEKQAGLLEYTLENYTPRIYKELANAQTMKSYKRPDGMLSTYLSSSEHRSFDTLAQATRAGYVPELDAAVLYAQRVMASQKKLAHDTFNTGVSSMFGKADQIPSRVREDLKFIGDGVYPQNWEESTRKGVEIFDTITNAFKKFATVVKPAFAAKQVVSNLAQGFAVQGVKAFGVLDPRVMGDALDTVLTGSARFSLKTALGQTFSPGELTQLTKDFDIIRGTTSGGDRFTRGLKQQLRTDNIIGKASMGSEALEGTLKFASGMGNYLNWPAHVEDSARAALFFNGLRIGHAPKDAAALVDKALFNYGNGLSALEAQYIKRAVPFYSFQRFALPLVAETIATNPGRVAAAAKFGRMFPAIWNKRAGGDTLTPAEVNVIPGYQLEQTSFLEGFDPRLQATFKNFNSFSPLDVLGGITTDKNGDVDIPRTLEKGFLAQLNPLLKVPLEVAMKKKLFSGQEIKAGGKLGDVEPNTVIRNLVATLAASSGGVFPAALGALVGDTAGKLIPEDVIKRALGWSEGTDLATGKRQVYINPTLAYAIESFVPAWSEVLRQSKPDLNASEKAQSLMFGIGTSKIDLAQSQKIRMSEQRKQAEEIKHDFNKAIATGRQDRQSLAMQDYQDLMKIIAEDQAINSANPPVRGMQQ